jgi:hypothetical protein
MTAPLPPDELRLVEDLFDRFSELRSARYWLPRSLEDVALDPVLACYAIIEYCHALSALDDCALKLHAKREAGSPSGALIDIATSIGDRAQREIVAAEEVRLRYFGK